MLHVDAPYLGELTDTAKQHGTKLLANMFIEFDFYAIAYRELGDDSGLQLAADNATRVMDQGAVLLQSNALQELRLQIDARTSR